ncbi:hypothetical protein [Rhodocyclus gracilis]|uniref:Uncharacterized protein n=1 Tax=Rhodocyclus tenuis TaxID=1066 RepID=A0A6L5JUE2_RHOTE|nr:hypothetical protein [Rhodocyclus gracilis]MQY50839.1 hypothetical protein [Rhodocyclus gracilis]
METDQIEAIIETAADGQADAEAQAQADAAAAAPIVDPVDETRALFGVVVAMASPLLPYLPTIYTEDKLTKLASAYVPVAAKYQWNVGGWLAQYGAEIALVGVALPLAVQTAKAHKAFMAERTAEDEKKEQGDKPAPTAAAPALPISDTGGQLMPA